MGPGMMHQEGGGMGMMQQRGGGMGMMQQRGSGMGPGMMHQMGRGSDHRTMQGGPGLAFTDPTQVDTLKRELGITATQEPAWSKYAKTLTDAATTIKTTRESVDPAEVAKLSPAERYAFVSKRREAAQKQFDAVKAAADELFATLDDTQKATAEDILPGLASFGPGPMRGADMRGPQRSQHGH
jgi:hypothetical protein